MVAYAPRDGSQRRAVNTKITDGIRSRLEEAAAQANRTLSAEVEWRLVRSFLDDKRDEFTEQINSDPDTRDLNSTIEVVLGSVQKFTEASWKDDQLTRDATAAALGLVLQLLFSDAPSPLPAAGTEERRNLERQRAIARGQGKMMALSILAPRLKDSQFAEFVQEVKVASGYQPSGSEADEDYRILREVMEKLSNPQRD